MFIQLMIHFYFSTEGQGSEEYLQGLFQTDRKRGTVPIRLYSSPRRRDKSIFSISNEFELIKDGRRVLPLQKTGFDRNNKISDQKKNTQEAELISFSPTKYRFVTHTTTT